LVEAQQPTKMARIGVLPAGSPSSMATQVEAFRQGLRELGYVEGKNILLEYRYGEGKRERYPDLADEMVRLKPDVIVVSSTGFTARHFRLLLRVSERSNYQEESCQ
jgi:putative tryptophan/tyrosine transport system substrate-binding protein